MGGANALYYAFYTSYTTRLKRRLYGRASAQSDIHTTLITIARNLSLLLHTASKTILF